MSDRTDRDRFEELCIRDCYGRTSDFESGALRNDANVARFHQTLRQLVVRLEGQLRIGALAAQPDIEWRRRTLALLARVQERLIEINRLVKERRRQEREPVR